MECTICKNKIKEGELIIRLLHGTYNKDDFGGYAFEENKANVDLGYVHFNCLDRSI